MAASALFFHETLSAAGTELWLDEDNARHVVQVLRMKEGTELLLTDGKGQVAHVHISAAEKKKCRVKVDKLEFHEPAGPALHLCVAFTKNSSRNEWLLEKATELGVRSITPLAANRSEREKIKHERWHNILVSALLQSQQYYLPQLHSMSTVKEALKTLESTEQKFIAHCIVERVRKPLTELLKPATDAVIFIGPEGDFTEEEVNLCVAAGASEISIGKQRLRTETAAMAVCAYFNLGNDV